MPTGVYLRNPADKEKRRLSQLGRHQVSHETRAKLSIKAKNRPPISEETREKLGASRRGELSPMFGKEVSPETRKKIGDANRGNTPSEATRYKMRLAKLGKYVAEKHPNWQGGISFVPYPIGWNRTHKEQVRYRDGYKCKICGKHEVEEGKQLAVHHIDYVKENISVTNLVSLCNSCHAKTNFNRAHWINFFKQQATLQSSTQGYMPHAGHNNQEEK